MTKDQAQQLLQKHYHDFCDNNSYGETKTDLKVKEVVRALNRHDQVKKAYVSSRGSLIVLTKRLFPIDPSSHQHYPQIGRFTIRIRYGRDKTTEDGISIANQDYHTRSDKDDFDGYFEHPHVTVHSEPNMCFGENEDTAEAAYDNGDLYGLVDFILLSLTTWNQDDGNPYLNYEAFYELRKRRKSVRFIEKEAI